MITGLVMIAVSLAGFYYARKTDLEEVVVEADQMNRLYLYLGMMVLLIVGIISIVADI